MVLNRGLQRLSVTPHGEPGLARCRQLGADLDRRFTRAGIAQGIVQQIHHQSAQVLDIEVNRRLSGVAQDLQPSRCRVLPRPVIGQLPGQIVKSQGVGVRGRNLFVGACNVQHFIHNFGQALGVLSDHRRELAVARFVQVFFEESVGLGNSGQRVSDLMRHGGRHAAHGCHFFGAHAGFHLTQILQEHHAQTFVTTVWGRSQTRAHMQASGIVPRVNQVDVGFLRRLRGKGAAHEFSQCQPGELVAHLEGHCAGHIAGRQQASGRWIGRAHHACAVDDQHAIGQGFNHQFIDPRLHARDRQAAFDQLFLPRQTQGQLIGQQRHQKEPRATQAGLQKARAEVALTLRRTPPGVG